MLNRTHHARQNQLKLNEMALAPAQAHIWFATLIIILANIFSFFFSLWKLSVWPTLASG